MSSRSSTRPALGLACAALVVAGICAAQGAERDGSAQSRRPGNATSHGVRVDAPATPMPSRPTQPPAPLIERVTWTRRAGVRVLTVIPTAAGRDAGADAVWAELTRRAPDARTPGMADQLRCHVLFAATKPAWHLEPERPAAGWVETVRSRCNPGSLVDPDL